MTFSIAARCVRTGEFGVAVSSSSPAVAARCAYVRAGVGAACSQNVTDPRLGPALLDALADGAGAEEAVKRLADAEPHAAWRQLTAVGVRGVPAQHSGSGTLGVYAHAVGADVVAAGNLLADPGVPAAMAEAFATSPDAPLGLRLTNALAAGAAAGGEAGPVHSAGLLIAADVPWPVTDLRVDWTDGDPVAELAALWRRWEPQCADYVRRALDPGAAPGYGVPGDPA
ncbi:DUF1028 domain-containing protein [Streptomyces pinistramenti]|uniref:DUF1028 domain-containing protein n=1 Tax=Streptomyces pinistramenti TaxID=2884812 RepID=UPI001D075548|nr:DUF1028 domain-containing protein [Streptomyces pinistramenti]MCB5909192.1 DUF1028 domain-containing protein [Streptomyces pinistramenti]